MLSQIENDNKLHACQHFEATGESPSTLYLLKTYACHATVKKEGEESQYKF